MYSTNKNIAEQIIKSLDIVEVISKDIELTKKGNNYVGLCPFHSDNNPSFTVSPEKKIYKCFVCDAGGNVISYYQNYNKLSYNETIKTLAARVGISYNLGPVIKKDNAHILNEEVANFYHSTLTVVNEGKIAKDYLMNRGYDLDEMKFFNMGYASNKLDLNNYLTSLSDMPFGSSEISDSGLFNNNGSMFFNNRLIIPISDEEGRVVGFSGRAIGDDSIKYLNSRDSKTFEKGKVLYNLNKAKDYLQNNEIIIVEGFFDVFALKKIGYSNVIAIMGTAFTPNHLKLFNKYKLNKFVLCLDNDDTGIKTSIKLGEFLIKNGFSNITSINFNEHKDIDEVIKANREFKLENAKTTYIEFKLKHLPKYYNLDSFEGKTQFINTCITGIDKTDLTFTKLVASSLSVLTGLDTSSINDIINNLKLKEKSPNLIEHKIINHEVVNQPSISSYDDRYAPNNVNTTQIEVVTTQVATKYQALLVSMLKDQQTCNEIISEVNNQNINIEEIKKYIEIIINGYKTLNTNFDVNYTLINNKSISFDFFDFLGDKELYLFFNKLLENNIVSELSATEIVAGINRKIPGLSILRAGRKN